MDRREFLRAAGVLLIGTQLPSTEWTYFTPTLIGDGTLKLVALYKQIGNVVIIQYRDETVPS